MTGQMQQWTKRSIDPCNSFTNGDPCLIRILTPNIMLSNTPIIKSPKKLVIFLLYFELFSLNKGEWLLLTFRFVSFITKYSWFIFALPVIKMDVKKLTVNMWYIRLNWVDPFKIVLFPLVVRFTGRMTNDNEQLQKNFFLYKKRGNVSLFVLAKINHLY